MGRMKIYKHLLTLTSFKCGVSVFLLNGVVPKTSKKSKTENLLKLKSGKTGGEITRLLICCLKTFGIKY